MSRKQTVSGGPGRLEALLASGDHRAAARVARATLADPEAPADRQARARAVLSSLSPDRFALAVGLLAVGVALALAIWVAAGGAR
jgi:hypothetical protein